MHAQLPGQYQQPTTQDSAAHQSQGLRAERPADRARASFSSSSSFRERPQRLTADRPEWPSSVPFSLFSEGRQHCVHRQPKLRKKLNEENLVNFL